MEAKEINLSEWEYFGEGGSSTCYVNKLDGNIVLKLNNTDIPEKRTEGEYLSSKYFNESGFPSPAIYEFVTDGERFGYTSQRIKGKMSYARALSQEPDLTEKAAARLALMAHKLHGTRADVSIAVDAKQSIRETFGDLSFLPEDVAEKVMCCFNSIISTDTCLHGDMNPGNLLTFEGKDYWIGVDEFLYGDPYLDVATMYMICEYLPSDVVSGLYHSNRKRLGEFFECFKKAYFGEKWNAPDVNAHIRDASIVKFCLLAKSRPEYLPLLITLVRGQRLRFLLKRLF